MSAHCQSRSARGSGVPRLADSPGMTQAQRGLNFPSSIHKSEHYSLSVRSRSALAMTDTELRLIAALAIIGLSISPSHG